MIDPNDPLNIVGGDANETTTGARSTRELLALHMSGQGLLSPAEEQRVRMALADPRTPDLLRQPYRPSQGLTFDASKLSEADWVKWRRDNL